MSRKVGEREFCRPNSVPNQSTVGLQTPSYAQAIKSTSSLERPFVHTQQGSKNQFEHEGQYQQGDPKYQDKNLGEYANQQKGVQTQFECSSQEADKQDQKIDGSQQPSSKSSIKPGSNRSRSRSTSNSKGGMTPNSHASLHSAFNIAGSNRPTDRQHLHVASFSSSDTSVKSRPTNPNGTPAPYQGIQCNMSMTGGKDGASNIVPGKPSLDGFDEGSPQNQVTKKKAVSGETNSSGHSSCPPACQGRMSSGMENEHDSPQDVEATKIIQHDHLPTGSDCNTESKTSIHCSEHTSEHTSSGPEQQLIEGTESNPQDKTLFEKIGGFFTSPGGTDYKRMYDQEKKKYDKEKKKYEEQKTRNQQMLDYWEHERGRYERNKRVLEQNLESMTILYQEEKKKSEVYRKMVLEKREGGFSTTEPPYDEISTKYEGLFGAMAKAVVDSCRPLNATREDKRAHKRKWMKCLCYIVQALYSRNKGFLLNQAFSEIFTPRRTSRPDHDPDQSKMEVDVYGHLVEALFKKHQASQPSEDYVCTLVSKSQKTAAENYGLHVELDGSIKLERFVREAVQVCWAMLTVNPPMLLDTSEVSKNEDTQRVQTYGVGKGMEDAVEDDAAQCKVEFYKPVLYKNYLRDMPTQKGWTGVYNPVTTNC